MKQLIFFFFFSFSLANLSINYYVNTTNFLLGDRIKREIIISKSKNESLSINIQSIESSEVKFITNNFFQSKDQIIIHNVYSSFELGEKQIPEAILNINGKEYSISEITINIQSILERVSANSFLVNLKPQKSLKLNVLAYAFLIIFITFFISVIIFVYNKFMKKNLLENIEVNKISPYDKAINSLEIISDPTKENCYKITEIIKIYVYHTLNYNFLEKTTSELKKEIVNISTNSEFLQSMISILNKLDVFKYTKANSSYNEFKSILQDSINLINNIENYINNLEKEEKW
jgi:hypothetical protein